MPVPYPVVVAVLGLAMGLFTGGPRHLVSADLILYGFVPALVFEGTIGIDLDQLKRVLRPVSLLATVQVAVTVVVIALCVHQFGGIDFPSSFVLGAILAATDPVAVISVLRQVAARPRPATLLEAESLFNDGTGVALFTAVVAGAVTGHPSLLDTGLRFVLVSIGAVAVGVAVGAVCLSLLRRLASRPMQFGLELAAAYAAFAIAQQLGFAGVLAVVACGVFAIRAGIESSPAWRAIGLVLTVALFFLVGVALPTREVIAALPLVLLTYLAMVVSRLPVYAMVAGAGLDRGERHLVFFGGVRGALGIALALSVAGLVGIDPRVVTLAYGAVVLSLLVQAGPLKPLTRRLG